MNTADRVIDIIRDQLGLSHMQLITFDTTFNALGVDSLDAVELAMELEEEFDFHISDEDAEKVKTVGEAIKYVEDALQNRHGVKPGYAPATAMWYAVVPYSSPKNERHEFATQNGFRVGEKIYFKQDGGPAFLYWDQVNNRWTTYGLGSWPSCFHNYLRNVATGEEVIIGVCGMPISDTWAEKARKAGVEPHWQFEAGFSDLPKIVETTRPIIAKGGTRIGTARRPRATKYISKEKEKERRRKADNIARWRNKEHEKGQVYIEWLKKNIDPVHLHKMATELQDHAKSELQKVVAALGTKPLNKGEYGRRSK